MDRMEEEWKSLVGLWKKADDENRELKEKVHRLEFQVDQVRRIHSDMDEWASEIGYSAAGYIKDWRGQLRQVLGLSKFVLREEQ